MDKLDLEKAFLGTSNAETSSFDAFEPSTFDSLDPPRLQLMLVLNFFLRLALRSQRIGFCREESIAKKLVLVMRFIVRALLPLNASCLLFVSFLT